jgi:hypothetical protein
MSNYLTEQVMAYFGRRLTYVDSLVRLAALRLYCRARIRGWCTRLTAAIARRPGWLLDLDAIRDTHAIPGWLCSGTQTTLISRIRGSAGRRSDFDLDFNPLNSRDKDRWLSVAAARIGGVPLPPVQLIRVGDIWFVLDGHQRISVARAMGEEEIDAVVAIWRVTAPLPWTRAPAWHRAVRQLAY